MKEPSRTGDAGCRSVRQGDGEPLKPIFARRVKDRLPLLFQGVEVELQQVVTMAESRCKLMNSFDLLTSEFDHRTALLCQ